MIKKSISHPYFYGQVFNRVKVFKSNASKLAKSLKNLIRKDHDLETIVYSLCQVFCPKIQTGRTSRSN
jgi:hypothetical protein